MIYLDNAAVEQPSPEVIDYVTKILKESWHNPNSLYYKGVESHDLVEKAKNIITKEINCSPDEITFCSCGSEANSLATYGYIKKHNLDYFVTSTIEHSSILSNPYARKLISVDKDGFYDIGKIKNIKNSFVSIQMANSEIGTIQDIKNIVQILHENNCIVHTDAVAAFGKIKIDVRDLGIDMMTATGQKIGGILGAAFLYKKKSIDLEPFIFGHDILRGGTPNVTAIAAMSKAVESINYSLPYSSNRNYVYDYIFKNIPDCYLVGASFEKRLPNNLYICFKGISGESLMILLDLKGVMVGTGSACNNLSMQASETLRAINMNDDDIHSCIRLSFSGRETQEDLDFTCVTIKNTVEQLRQFST